MQLAGDAERGRAASALQDHFVAGRLTVDELANRTELVLRARSRNDLRRALAGLPQFDVAELGRTALRGAALILLTGAWIVFSLALSVVCTLVLLIHGASGTELVAFLLVWLVPTALLTRLWRRSLHTRVRT